MASLAVVLITRNQSWNVDRLIGSVLRDTAGLPAAETVLVDSASTDGTAELAACHPIEVVRLLPGQRLTPAAGRHVGYGRTTAPLVLFLDGDMELCPGALGAALRVMEENPDVGALGGSLIERSPDCPGRESPVDDGAPGFEDASYLGGVLLARHRILDEVGDFNPHLFSEEEPELCLRIRHAGYRIVRLERPVAYHYSRPSDSLRTLFGRHRRKLYLGTGQVIRYHLRSELVVPYVRERGWGLAAGAAAMVCVVPLVPLVRARKWGGLAAWLWLLSALVIADSLKRGPARTAHSLLSRLLLLDGSVRGFLHKPLDVRAYSPRFEVKRVDERLR